MTLAAHSDFNNLPYTNNFKLFSKEKNKIEFF